MTGEEVKDPGLELESARESGGKEAEWMREVLGVQSRAMVKSARFSGSSFLPCLQKSIMSPLVVFHLYFHLVFL